MKRAARRTVTPQRIETRHDDGLIRIWLPARSYRPQATVRVTRAEADALVRNLIRRLSELPPAHEADVPEVLRGLVRDDQ